VFLAGFLHIHTLLLTTFFLNKKRGKNKKTLKNVKKNVYYIYGANGTAEAQWPVGY